MIRKYTTVAFTMLVLVASLSWTPVTVGAQLTQYTAVRVQKANTLAQEEKYAEAIETLNAIDANGAYDKAYVDRMLGVFYWQSDDTSLAIKHIRQAVESDLLEDEQAWTTKKMLADLLLNEQEFSQALPYYYDLVKAVPDSQKEDQLWLRIAQAHYQIEQYREVLNGIAKYDKFGRPDEVTPLSLKLGAQMQLKQWKGAIPTLERLIVLEPNKVNWWRQLAGLHLRLEQSKAALDTLALATLQGIELSQQDIHLKAQLYAQRGIPVRAAQTMATLEKLSQESKLLAEQATYWQMAKEWQEAISTWKLAAKLDEKYYWNLAQLQSQEGQYKAALASLDKVTDKSRKADVELARVRALYKLNDIETALVHAKRVNEINPSNEAQSWVKFLTQLREASSSGKV
ncbi:tetratricopeptide repeat protein [Vibrio sp. DBSS07]|uniref:Tetratricopeptide repeat protein n=2 Tax=Vibrio paucivorans TaxID=2829489 RepID=A0A9X3HSS5_9VIBR|nr:tetratricopeptide repeat protein [Vibrio paucivorans]MCW8335245.1 tetratricopeptide repeat protein [Vibrio paucivorans]